MKLRSTLFIVLLLTVLLPPASAFAHTGLDSSSPEKDEKVMQEVTQIEMLFKTKIEDLSNFTLKNGNDEKVPVGSITVKDKTMTGKLDTALPSGSYTVIWKIVGVDGHPITGEYSFSVEKSVIPEATPSENTEQPVQSDNSSATENNNSSANNQQPTSSEPIQEPAKVSSNQSPLMYVGLGVGLFVVVAAILFLINKRRTK
ncbi:copper resistance CopC family protein [Paenibacillus radicis (ex Gao et al. 2016)]|uniref:Copper resistance protein CopC n=1 Tax=Paenibacillus radicis (ex Gao et al. 2016) TaxID=1737354 RepID=A0A917H8D7_9BACL|nr:copper resistance protein CopC [Paenibacillus radicis (ex Gao et al. 2016)]GGG70543.1 copper resistance protein CopC [Paenibacillus radicis (ex Gao et al. 2016)]